MRAGACERPPPPHRRTGDTNRGRRGLEDWPRGLAESQGRAGPGFPDSPPAPPAPLQPTLPKEDSTEPLDAQVSWTWFYRYDLVVLRNRYGQREIVNLIYISSRQII